MLYFDSFLPFRHNLPESKAHERNMARLRKTELDARRGVAVVRQKRILPELIGICQYTSSK